jgi:3-phenylpropionate/trans-cinnamate dioxygenase ferredoxin reductase subunit
LTNKGETIPADFVVVGIGIEPNVKLAESAGLVIQNGILVDDRCCTSDPNVFAAGDCANFPYQGQRIRLESVGNAIEQSEVAAESIVGKSSHYNALPWFWSDQFHVKLQIAGLNAGYTEVVERIDGERISYWYYRDGEFKSVDAINDPISYMVGKKLIERGQTPDPKDIRSVSFNVKSLLRG